MTWPARRSAGVLLHPTSLPSPDGIGAAGPEARAFVDWAASAGFSVWQVLPLGPTGYGNAPYGCLSSFAGNPLLVDPVDLVREGVLPRRALDARPSFPRGVLDVEAARAWKDGLLHQAWTRYRDGACPPSIGEEFDAFVHESGHESWLDDWTLFIAFKAAHAGVRWNEWPDGPRDRSPAALDRARAALADDLGRHRFAQFLFHRQWRRLRQYARSRGIEILGDVPIYTILDSADVWANREYFRLDPSGWPEAVAGVPPDYFSETGQLWGNPLYRWERLAEDGYGWWIDRVAANLELADAVRLDHFRGFASYWEVPPRDETAIGGRWVEGPGRALFDAIRDRQGDLPFVAEDLGLITEDVHRLRDDLDLPGMKVLQFGFDDPTSIHRFDRVPARDLVYTGTHDNDTARGWFDSLPADAQGRVLDALDTDPEGVVAALVRAAYASDARLAVVPVQDVLGLGSEARMNTPGVEDGNWLWRLVPGQLDETHATGLRALTEDTGRSSS